MKGTYFFNFENDLQCELVICDYHNKMDFFFTEDGKIIRHFQIIDTKQVHIAGLNMSLAEAIEECFVNPELREVLVLFKKTNAERRGQL